MRQARLKAPDDHEVAYYHTISRVVNREYVLGEEEREQFVEMMRCYEHFCGVRVLTYCVMSNHFHLLLGRGTGRGTDLDEGQTDYWCSIRAALL